jgi:pimeloyl-ACP methyl ester carboxylesterase
MSTFVIVHGAWGSPAEMEPVVEPFESAGHAVVVVNLPCTEPHATLEQYAAAVRAELPDDAADIVLVGHSFGGFTVSTIAAENPGVPVVYVAAFVPQPGTSVLDLFIGRDPFAGVAEDVGIAAFGGLIVSPGAGLCAMNIDVAVAAVDPSEQDAMRSYLERTQRPQGIAALRQKWNGELPSAGRLTYVVTTADTLVSPERQRAMAASVGADVVEIDSGHSAFSEQPERLAELLVDAARR